MTKKTIKWSEISHLIDKEYHNMEFDKEEVELIEASDKAKIEDLLLPKDKEKELKNLLYNAVQEDKLEKEKEKKAITIRLSLMDIDWIKKVAENEGIPYQTLITSVVHKIATWQIKFWLYS